MFEFGWGDCVVLGASGEIGIELCVLFIGDAELVVCVPRSIRL